MSREPDQHYLALDALRFVAALGIVLHHCAIYADVMGWNARVAAFDNLRLCVDFFFALSGYVLTRSFENHLAQPPSQILARIIRLGLPAMAAALVAAVTMLIFGKPNIQAGDLSGSAWRCARSRRSPS